MSKQATCGSVRGTLQKRPDRREVVRLVQRRQRNELLQRRDHGCVDANGLAELESAVDDAMADGDEAMLGELRAQERDEMVERAVVSQLGAFTPRFLAR